ncbi:MAG: proline--tRNA ligase [Bdellovibrionaceae bacterium]|nr:proline--tRNA ligase [Pseudobdellovibrionaceae bacterium]
MKWSEIYLKTLKEKPAGASIPSHILLLRAGYISNTSQGIYLYNSLFLRSIQKFEKIVREELERQSAREILMPMVQTKKLWQKTGRWNKFEGLLLKMKGRTGAELCLGPTHEEIIIEFVQSGLNSWKDMPLNLYQIQTKYRDEIRPRFGLMRAREFIMKDAYSFDTSKQTALENYKKMFQAYQNIFNRLGVQFVVAKADSGAIGGSHSEEFHILAKKGEDELLVCDNFSANVEICPRQEPSKSSAPTPKAIEEFATPNIKTIQELAQFLNGSAKDLVKILFFISQGDSQKANSKDKVFAVLCMGDDEINPLKIKQNLGLKELPLLAKDKTIKEVSGANPGSCGPYKLKQNIPIYLDNYLKNKGNFITGANKDGFHFKNVNPNRDFKVSAYGDFCFAREGDLSPTSLALKKYRGIEVGHLFYLSDEYSKKMNLTYLDKQGKKHFVEMGCYGMGITRTLQAVIEQSHDDKGIIWPLSITPFAVYICLIDPDSPEVLKALDKLKTLLDQQHLDYFIDDRKERPGVKFKDADLIGLPLRIDLGVRDLKNNQIEICIRKNSFKEKLNLKELENKLPSYISNL